MYYITFIGVIQLQHSTNKFPLNLYLIKNSSVKLVKILVPHDPGISQKDTYLRRDNILLEG